MPRWFLWALTLGFALGGFADGILLHQVLEWHHFLSLVGGDLRFQILADGLFHLAVYGLAVVALLGLWSARRAVAVVPGRHVAGALLAGFALWQLVDVAFVHWVLGIHRIRVDVPNPMAWDLGWLAVVGLPPAVLAWLLLRGGGGGNLRPAAILWLGVLTGASGWWAAQPPAGAPFTAVVWRADATPAAMLAAVAAADGRVAWADSRARLMLVQVAPADRWRLWRDGALLVGGSGVPAGCFGWSRPAA